MPELSYLEAIRTGLLAEMRQDASVYVFGEDVALGGPFGVTQGIAEEMGAHRVVNTPISEGTVMGVAIGAALSGLRPVVEIMFVDFITLAMDQLVNHAAKLHYMSGGQLKVPLTVRVQCGVQGNMGAHHSQSLESWFLHVPGLKVVMPSNPADAQSLMRAAIRDDNPVLFVEHRGLYFSRAEVPEDGIGLPMGKASVLRSGADVTVAALSRMVVPALEAADALAGEGISVEVVDLRGLVPLDVETLVDSVKKTSRLIVVHEAVEQGGAGAEIAARVQEEALYYLDSPILRVAAPNAPVPCAPPLESQFRPRQGTDRGSRAPGTVHRTGLILEALALLLRRRASYIFLLVKRRTFLYILLIIRRIDCWMLFLQRSGTFCPNNSTSRCDGPPRPHTRRRVSGRLRFPGKATAVVGMRRAGKTTFLHQLRQEFTASGTGPSQAPYVSFEDERLTGLEARHLDFLLDEYYRLSPSGQRTSPVMWCFDEIQLVPGWERFVRRLLDTESVEVFVTGSSAALLSLEIATALRGRAWQVLMHPFGFDEALRHQGIEIPDRADALARDQRLRLEQAFLTWLVAGGFPEAQGLDTGSRHQLLRDYVDVAVLRDVMERHGVGNVTALRWLVRHLLGNAGALFSVEKFHAALKSQGIAIARDTVHQFLGYLEDCFLVRVVWMESSSDRQRMVNPRKAYPVDAGLIPVFDRTGRANVGHALETAVLIELERRRLDVTYVRTRQGYEVDFMARSPDGRRELIQVCADASDPATAERELRALVAASQQFPDAGMRLLTLSRDGIPDTLPDGVVAQPAWVWMLGYGETG